LKIEVMGPGCPRCRQTKETVEKVLKSKNISAQVEHISEMKAFSQRGVLMTPAVFIDGEKKVEGRVPTVKEIEDWLS